MSTNLRTLVELIEIELQKPEEERTVLGIFLKLLAKAEEKDLSLMRARCDLFETKVSTEKMKVAPNPDLLSFYQRELRRSVSRCEALSVPPSELGIKRAAEASFDTYVKYLRVSGDVFQRSGIELEDEPGGIEEYASMARTLSEASQVRKLCADLKGFYRSEWKNATAKDSNFPRYHFAVSAPSGMGKTQLAFNLKFHSDQFRVVHMVGLKLREVTRSACIPARFD